MSQIEANSVYMPSQRCWARVKPAIERHDCASLTRGRELLGALLTKALTGRSWDELIAVDREWKAVEQVQRRWQESGLLEELSQIMLVRLDG